MTLLERHLVLDKCRDLFQNARGSVVKAMPLLHKIYTEKIYEGQFSTFEEYVNYCGIDKGQASRLIAVYEHYVVQNGIKLSQLNQANPEKLYKARAIKGGADKQLACALELTAGELNAAIATKDDGSEHECVPVTFCQICHRRM